MKNKLGSLLGLIVMAAGTGASATAIVDTGTPTAPPGFTSLPFRAGIFTVSAPTVVESFERFLVPRSIGPGSWTVDFRIFSANEPGGVDADLPGEPLPGYSASFEIPGRPNSADPGVAGWHGVSGLNWFLAPGNYWMVTSPGSAFWRAPICDAGDTACLADEVALEAVYLDPDGDDPLGWYPAGARSGWRLNGTVVPEPGTLTLLGLGLAGLGMSRRRASPRA